MSRRIRGMSSLLAGLLSGAVLLGIGPCSSADLQAQMANGLRTALTGLFNLGTTEFANAVFDVED